MKREEMSLSDAIHILMKHIGSPKDPEIGRAFGTLKRVEKEIKSGDLSDGYHSFNDLYAQRLYLFAALVKQNPSRAWKSYRHEDGQLCFGGGWFIVGIDTDKGSFTYHYENKHWDLFNCVELPVGKKWDGHTDKDVDRLLSLDRRFI